MSMTPFLGKPPENNPGKKGHKRDYRVAVIVAVAVLAAGYGIASVIGGDHTPRKRVMDTVALRLVPPPPPPKQEPPPPPPKLMEKPKIQPPLDKVEPPKQVDAPPPGPLALDAKGGAGSDSFGLGGKPGGADYSGDGNGARFSHYGSLVQAQISKILRADERLKGVRFRGTVRIRLTADGTVAGIELLHGTGDSNVDQYIQQDIAGKPGLPEAAPTDLPKMVVRVRDDGTDS